MKLVLTSLNSKYVHSCLSIRYLQGYSKNIIDTRIREFTINQNIDYIVSELYKEEATIVGFSTYIWNLNETLEICETLKIIKPDIKIFLGGPEVSYDSESILRKYKYIDWIIYGEGELSFKELIEKYTNGESMEGVRGVVYRDGTKIIKNPARPLIRDLNTIPSPYDESVGEELKNRIIYYESSRGCPFGCKFCLSSTIKGVRYFNLDRVKKELGILIDAEVRQVKFVDRTFNANKEYALEIMNYIIDRNPKNINFHFEVTAHLLDEEMLQFLSGVPEGLFQFEVGVQSTNDKTIEAVGRTTDFPKLRKVTKRIKSYKKIHQHLDLIAGLPYEDYNSFEKSFNDVYEIRPEKIQLGFLKLLKGSDLRKDEKKYGFKYLDKPPYEVLETNYMSYGEIRRLKLLEEILEIYYNGELFRHSLDYLISNFYLSPFRLYEDISLYWEKKDYHKISHSRRRLYEILLEFYKYKKFEKTSVFNEVLKLDFLENNKGLKIPNKIKRNKYQLKKGYIHDLLKLKSLLTGPLREYQGIQTRELIKKVRIEKFNLDILDLINSNYKFDNRMLKEVYILIIYKDGVINNSESYNVNEYIEELKKWE